MDKRYQVFVSSTYTDLKEERQKVLQALMEMDCIPSGMEMFPAFDEQQWDFIKKVIDDCDYYLLIIGGRYGSVDSEGISYTEKEYQYAVDKGIKVIALIHESPDLLTLDKSEIDPVLRTRLQEFKKKVMTGRLVKFWKSADMLPGLVALSLSRTIKTYPATGWVRADQISSTSLLTEINELRKENSQLQAEIETLKSRYEPSINNLARLDSCISVRGYYDHKGVFDSRGHQLWQVEASWGEIIGVIAPLLFVTRSEEFIRPKLTTHFFVKFLNERQFDIDLDLAYEKLSDYTFETIKIQLIALNIVSITHAENPTWIDWSLTPKGMATLLEVRTIKEAESPSVEEPPEDYPQSWEVDP